MPEETKRTPGLSARIDPEALAIVKQAAEIQGLSLSEFVATAALKAAHETIEGTYLIRLSIEDQSRFVDLLLNPPALTPAMERAKKAHARLINPAQ